MSAGEDQRSNGPETVECQKSRRACDVRRWTARYDHRRVATPALPDLQPQFTELAIDCPVLILLLQLTGRWKRIGPTRAARGGRLANRRPAHGDPLDHGLGLVAG